MSPSHINHIRIWLYICCALVLATVLLGGAVRLTGSGLSMVDWRPFGGVIPPLGDDAWRRVFDAYRRSPEFRLVNPDMTLAGFRFIFWMEYAHRLLGRVIGVAFLLPFAFFCWRGMLSRTAIFGLSLLFLLGAAQGFLGWYMVQSGLAGDPKVSHYRLLAHFLLAAIIYAGLLIMAVRIGVSGGAKTSVSVIGIVALTMIFMMLASGALVAGTGGGSFYNTWPRMGDEWLPPTVFAGQSWTDNPIAIQFAHRWLAVVTVVTVTVFAAQLWCLNRRRIAVILFAVTITQFTLGITTLINAVPTHLGIAHQTGAMILLTVTVIAIAKLAPSSSP